ncbi:HDOD domain-containing protein [Pseudoalteromonas fenneropenaei]|uniref:HDOD domain-containing protein n=1 Tax=Pseudoalteromonas fenneropenaei TaxID=1737459 RepID=A0ABV7CFM9_9GAMM
MAITLTQQEKLILKQVALPPRPQALLDFAAETKQPEPDISKIAKILQSDGAISAAVLQVVNSAAFRRNREIDAIDQAIMMLGLKRIIPLVKAVALKSSVKTSAALATFWDDQTKIAECCAQLALRLNKPGLSNYAYMLGLFHFAGVPILYQHFKDYDCVFEFAEQNGWDKANVFQSQQYNTCHATIGALLAQQWGLPKAMIYAIYYQHDMEDLYSSGELDEVGLDLLSILKIARSACYGDKYQQDWLVATDQICDHFNLSDDEVTELIQDIMLA